MPVVPGQVSGLDPPSKSLRALAQIQVEGYQVQPDLSMLSVEIGRNSPLVSALSSSPYSRDLPLIYP